MTLAKKTVLTSLLVLFIGCNTGSGFDNVKQNFEYSGEHSHGNGALQCKPQKLGTGQLEHLEIKLLRSETAYPEKLFSELCADGPAGTDPASIQNARFHVTMIWERELEFGASGVARRATCRIFGPKHSMCSDLRTWVEWPGNISFPVDPPVDIQAIEAIRLSLQDNADFMKRIVLLGDGDARSKAKKKNRFRDSYRIFAFDDNSPMIDEHIISKACLKTNQTCSLETIERPSYKVQR